jgi:hypothetical protein
MKKVGNGESNTTISGHPVNLDILTPDLSYRKKILKESLGVMTQIGRVQLNHLSCVLILFLPSIVSFLGRVWYCIQSND